MMIRLERLEIKHAGHLKQTKPVYQDRCCGLQCVAGLSVQTRESHSHSLFSLCSASLHDLVEQFCKGWWCKRGLVKEEAAAVRCSAREERPTGVYPKTLSPSFDYVQHEHMNYLLEPHQNDHCHNCLKILEGACGSRH